jgi:outer membrane protein OmpA-like peptidoglycan-associated protein
MAANLLDNLKGYMTSDNISAIASFLGVSSSNTQSAVTAALPVLLGGLAGKTSDPKGASEIYDMVKGLDGSNLSNLGSLLAGGTNTDEIISSGSNFINSIFGSKTDVFNQYISKESGIDPGSLTKFLPLIGSIVMGFLGKQSKSGGISDAAGMASLLAGQLPALKGLIPSGMTSSLGLGNLFADAEKTVTQTASKVEEEAKGGLGKILLPLLAIAAILGLIYLFGKGCNDKTVTTAPKKDTVQKVVTKDSAKMNANMPKEWLVLGKFAILKLISGDSINIPELGIERKLIGFITDSTKKVDKETWFSFDRILFETDKATLRPESMDQIRSIAAIMKAYPNVELKIGGYTDNTGDAKHNQQLSTDRANAVMNAIVGMGIPSARLKAEGYGPQFPVADNSTEEGRAKNRRIDVRVTKK